VRITGIRLCTILTSALAGVVHNRMPVILTDQEEQHRYLDEPDLDRVLDMLRTLPEGQLYMYRVSETVNSPKFNQPGLHDKVEEPPTLF
ncbi:MAG: SOS response-associated peptidase family protein, partial [Bacteroidota bacterium]